MSFASVPAPSPSSPPTSPPFSFPSSPSSIPSAPSDRFRFVKFLGRGNFGTVNLYETVDGNTEGSPQYVVIKEIPLSELDVQSRQHCEQEVSVLSSLQHPFIVRYRESWLDRVSGRLYIVMAFCEGGDLFQKIRQRRDKSPMEYFDENTILDWTTQLALALRFVHKHKFIHRDIKSQNVFLTQKDQFDPSVPPEVRLGDFGIARVLSATGEFASTVVGTPLNMAPEVCSAQPYSFASDVWAFGILLFELIELSCPFLADNVFGLAMKIVQSPHPQMKNPHVSDALKSLVDSMLQKDPKDRPTMEEIVDSEMIQKRVAVQIERTKTRQQRKNSLNAAPSTPVAAALAALPTTPMAPPTPSSAIASPSTPGERLRNHKLQKAAERERELKEAMAMGGGKGIQRESSREQRAAERTVDFPSSASPPPKLSVPLNSPTERPIKSSGVYSSVPKVSSSPTAADVTERAPVRRSASPLYDGTEDGNDPFLSSGEYEEDFHPELIDEFDLERDPKEFGGGQKIPKKSAHSSADKNFSESKMKPPVVAQPPPPPQIAPSTLLSNLKSRCLGMVSESTYEVLHKYCKQIIETKAKIPPKSQLLSQFGEKGTQALFVIEQIIFCEMTQK